MRQTSKWRGVWRRELLRPFIHMAFTRFLLALAAALLINFFLGEPNGRDLRETAFLLFAFLFALLAVIAWLRLDGVRLPKLMMLRVNPRKKPSRMYGDMADWLDEPPGPVFEDLEDDEKDLCLLLADAVCAALFLIGSLFV